MTEKRKQNDNEEEAWGGVEERIKVKVKVIPQQAEVA